MIKKGEKFFYGTHFIPGEKPRNSKTCTDCKSIENNFFNGGWLVGSMVDDLENYFNDSWQEDLPSSCISQLTPAARDRVCDILQEFQEAENSPDRC